MEARDSSMPALPPGSRDGKAFPVTGVVCPDCPGVLSVEPRPRGNGGVTFRCRIGHRYDTDGLLGAKEHNLEAHLWAAVTACEELSALLADLDRDLDRRARVLALAAAVRRLIDGDRPVQLEDPTPAIPDDEPTV